MRFAVIRAVSAAAALLFAVAAALTPASAASAGPLPTICSYAATLDFAPYLSAVTTSRHVIGSGRLSGCSGIPEALSTGGDFRVVGDGPANCLGQKFHLYQEIYWDNGEYSLVELNAASLLGIGVHAGEVRDYGYAGSEVRIASAPGPGFLFSCLSQYGVHQVRFTGAQTFLRPV